jgi:AcrR family transcriptional regulator
MTGPRGESAQRRQDWRACPELELTPILAAALDAFYEAGYHGASVRHVASRVGVTIPALYYHHRNKEAILFSLLDSSIEQLLTLCVAAHAEAEGAPDQQLLNLIECTSRFMARSGKVAFLDAEIRALSPELRSVYSAKRAKIESMLLTSLEDSNRAGLFSVSSPRDTARALLGMVQAIATWYRPGGELSPDEVAARYVDIAAHAVGASPELLERVRNPRGNEPEKRRAREAPSPRSA